MPPRKYMGKTVEAQPGIVSCVNRRIAIAQAANKKLNSETTKPMPVIKRKGRSEKDVIPCHAKEIIFLAGILIHRHNAQHDHNRQERVKILTEE